MPLKVSYKNDAFPKDYEFDVHGIGLVKNGGTITLDKEGEERAVSLLGMPVKDYVKGSADLSVEGTTELKAAEVENLTEGGGEG
jgi:hypothetical protein